MIATLTPQIDLTLTLGPPPDVFEGVLRLVVATLLGAAVGYERESQDKPAGLKTHALVGLGAAAFALMTLLLLTASERYDTRPDPIRLIVGIATGIGFLGAGTIIQSRDSVRGLTTAASIWTGGALGIACGLGQYIIAGAVVLLTYMVFGLLGLVEVRFIKKRREERLRKKQADAADESSGPPDANARP